MAAADICEPYGVDSRVPLVEAWTFDHDLSRGGQDFDHGRKWASRSHPLFSHFCRKGLGTRDGTTKHTASFTAFYMSGRA